MADLLLAYVVMFGLSVLVAVLTARTILPTDRQLNLLLLTLSVVAMFAYWLHVAGQLFLARAIPHSAAIVWTNLTPVLGASAGGWLLHIESIPRSRRWSMCLVLWLASCAALLWPNLGPLLRPPPPSEHVVDRGVVMQSSPATCSPAAAATLLEHSGIGATEAALIPLCLTDASGTPTLGLYRGLKLAAKPHGRQLRLFHGSLAALYEQEHWPILLPVELPAYGVDDPRYEQQWGWIPGTGHSVVALKKLPSGGVLIADPSVGIEQWTRQDMQILWHGQGLYLE